MEVYLDVVKGFAHDLSLKLFSKARSVATPINVIIGANVVAFVTFKIYWNSLDWARVKKEYMMLSRKNIREKRYSSMIGSLFMHVDVFHLVRNMYGLYMFAPALTRCLKPTALVGLYLSAGIAGGFASLAYHSWVPGAGIPASQSVGADDAGCGASGAIMGLVGYVCVRYPGVGITSPLIKVPLPAFVFGSVFFAEAFDKMYKGYAPGEKRIGDAAHAGGFLLGTTFGVLHINGLVKC